MCDIDKTLDLQSSDSGPAFGKFRHEYESRSRHPVSTSGGLQFFEPRTRRRQASDSLRHEFDTLSTNHTVNASFCILQYVNIFAHMHEPPKLVCITNAAGFC